MISSEVDKFYRRVIKDFIVNLGKNEFLLRELQQNHIYLNQIEEKMFQKMQNPSALFRRLTTGYNEIEREMVKRYAVSEDVPHIQREHIVNPIPNSISDDDSNLQSFSNDLDLIDNHHSAEPLPKVEHVKKEEVLEDSEPESEQDPLKRRASELSYDDLSSASHDSEIFRNLRENVKIHILGTYDLQSKKHDFKMDKTELRLENVIIKAEGVSKQIFLKNLSCTSRKRIHL